MEINIGDTVRIIRTGRIYPSYKSFGEKFGYPNSATYLGQRDDRDIRNGTIGKVLVKNNHLQFSNTMLLILQCFDEKENQIIIDIEGVKLMKKQDINRRIIK
jgi:hypothetical protein